MTAKKKTTIVPVLRSKIVVAKRLGTRESAEFEDELRALFDKGYKVVQKDSDGSGGVKLTLVLTEEWTWEEFIADLREHTKVPAGVASFRADFGGPRKGY